MRAQEFITEGWWDDVKDHFNDPDYGWHATNAVDTTRDLIGGIRNKFRSKMKDPPQPSAPIPTPAPTLPTQPQQSASQPTSSIEPDVEPQDSAGPSRMVSVHPYQGGSYAYNVIKNQWVNNRTNKVIDDPAMVKQLNISYNKANQRQTLYNLTPADKLRLDRERKQRAAVNRVNQELEQ